MENGVGEEGVGTEWSRLLREGPWGQLVYTRELREEERTGEKKSKKREEKPQKKAPTERGRVDFEGEGKGLKEAAGF